MVSKISSERTKKNAYALRRELEADGAFKAAVNAYLKLEKLSHISEAAFTEALVQHVVYVRSYVESMLADDTRAVERQEVRKYLMQGLKHTQNLISVLPQEFLSDDPDAEFDEVDFGLPAGLSRLKTDYEVLFDADLARSLKRLEAFYQSALGEKWLDTKTKSRSPVLRERELAAERSYQMLKEQFGIQPKITVDDELVGLSNYAGLYKLMLEGLGYKLEKGPKDILSKAKKSAESSFAKTFLMND